MNAITERRLANEHELLLLALPALQRFVTAVEHRGSPPVLHRFELQPFGFLILSANQQPRPYDRGRHGPAHLVIATDPRIHPQQPWRVWVHVQDHVAFSPHIGAAGIARGAMCWNDAREGYGIHDWLLPAVVLQSLRILAGEVVAYEGYSLNDDAKVWYAEHRDQMPLSRVPQPRDPRLQLPVGTTAQSRAQSSVQSSVQSSNLGIEFGAIS